MKLIIRRKKEDKEERLKKEKDKMLLAGDGSLPDQVDDLHESIN